MERANGPCSPRAARSAAVDASSRPWDSFSVGGQASPFFVKRGSGDSCEESGYETARAADNR
jgi:hypothetical protein